MVAFTEAAGVIAGWPDGAAVAAADDDDADVWAEERAATAKTRARRRVEMYMMNWVGSN